MDVCHVHVGWLSVSYFCNWIITLLHSLETFWHIEPFPDIINDIYLTMNSVDYLGLQKCIYMMIMYTKYVQSVT